MSPAQGAGFYGMNRDDIRNYIQNSLVDITDDETLVLAEDTAPDDIAGWDSVNHIKLVFAVEEGLGVSFEVSELVMPASVKDFIDLIQSKN
jgi:acyl carrier protein